MTQPFLSIRMECSVPIYPGRRGRRLHASPIESCIVDAHQIAAIIYDKIPFISGRSFSENHISLEIQYLFPMPPYFLAGTSSPGSHLIFKLFYTSQQGGSTLFTLEDLSASKISWGYEFSPSF